MMKVIFDRVPGLERWGTLLGDQTPEQENNNPFRFVNLKEPVGGTADGKEEKKPVVEIPRPVIIGVSLQIAWYPPPLSSHAAG